MRVRKTNRNLWKVMLVLVAGAWYAPAATAVGYDDFPAELQLVLDERMAVLDAEGGICIAGQVTYSDGTPITGGEDVLVNLYHDGLDEPMWVYADGWFIMGRIVSSDYAGAGKGFVLRAFGYDPIDASVAILDGEMTYLEFEMAKTPPENLSRIDGIVFDESNGHLFSGGGWWGGAGSAGNCFNIFSIRQPWDGYLPIYVDVHEHKSLSRARRRRVFFRGFEFW